MVLRRAFGLTKVLLYSAGNLPKPHRSHIEATSKPHRSHITCATRRKPFRRQPIPAPHRAPSKPHHMCQATGPTHDSAKTLLATTNPGAAPSPIEATSHVPSHRAHPRLGDKEILPFGDDQPRRRTSLTHHCFWTGGTEYMYSTGMN
jgi:hypothetical protein